MLSGETEARPEPLHTLANEDPAKLTHSIIDFASRHCNSIEQLQWPSSRRPHGTTKQSEGSPSRGGARLRRESGTARLAVPMALFAEQHVAKKQRLVSISTPADAPLATVEYAVQRSIISSPET